MPLSGERGSIDGYNFASGNFDQDGKIEFATGTWGSNSTAAVYECIGDNRYRCIFHDNVASPNCHDVWFGNDLDGDGRLEFIIGSKTLPGNSYGRSRTTGISTRHLVTTTSSGSSPPIQITTGTMGPGSMSMT